MFENWDDEGFRDYDSEYEEDDGSEVEKERDTVLESLLSKAWKTVDLSASVSSLIGGTLDPLHVTKLTGPIHIQEENDYVEVDLHLENTTLTGFSGASVKDLVVERRRDNLDELDIFFNILLDDIT